MRMILDKIGGKSLPINLESDCAEALAKIVKDILNLSAPVAGTYVCHIHFEAVQSNDFYIR